MDLFNKVVVCWYKNLNFFSLP
jgi:hypothetical protein